MNLTQEEKQQLVDAAVRARKHAYAPYSKYTVGAAIRTESGNVFTGCNVENAVFAPAVCAERTAVFKAISEGHAMFTYIAVVSKDGAFPCGVCRQVLREFASDLGILIADELGNWTETTLKELLPHSFGPENLGVK